jgi:hypothetical protein
MHVMMRPGRPCLCHLRSNLAWSLQATHNCDAQTHECGINAAAAWPSLLVSLKKNHSIIAAITTQTHVCHADAAAVLMLAPCFCAKLAAQPSCITSS